MSPAGYPIDEHSLSPPSTPTPVQSPFAAAPTLTNLPHTATLTPEVQTTSSYPKPSPPTFLYPELIVPPQIYSHVMQCDNSHNGPRSLHHSLAHGEDYMTTTPWLAVLVFLIVAIAAAWSVVVMLIHWRGTTTGIESTSSHNQHRGQGAEQAELECGWRAWLQRLRPWAQNGGGRYEVLHSAEQELDEQHEYGLNSAHDLLKEDASPTNPFLVAPDQPLNRRVKPRSSAEWVQEHRAYFSSAPGSRIPTTPSRRPSSPHSLSYTEMEDIEAEAREAQGRRASLAPGGDRAFWRQERASWVDLGLAAVDGAMDRLAGKIVRYADDGDKDEALLLPLAKGK
ncbi:hypothetical protein E8E11_006396 [Didymella keratinophila]|nr:hypothetical protein E8E11_006396 [Didymella keratinophila]